jgi:hypothetical protein
MDIPLTVTIIMTMGTRTAITTIIATRGAGVNLISGMTPAEIGNRRNGNHHAQAFETRSDFSRHRLTIKEE